MCVSSNRRDFIYDVYIPVYHTDKFNAFISLTMRMSDFAPPNIQKYFLHYVHNDHLFRSCSFEKKFIYIY